MTNGSMLLTFTLFDVCLAGAMISARAYFLHGNFTFAVMAAGLLSLVVLSATNIVLNRASGFKKEKMRLEHQRS